MSDAWCMAGGAIGAFLGLRNETWLVVGLAVAF